ncbi:MAG: heat shock protein HspQ [Gammaproteobacteria bacterium]|jgi:heat shock protein HspQ|nr:MAG: heat shock protein HspQ [Gammaproteobacteria bacterium]
MSSSDVDIYSALFSPGELVSHRLFGYRGVVVDVDAEFSLSEEWYESVAKSRPPKDEPWYHVLVHGSEQATYVAERNLEPDTTGRPVLHPMLGMYFRGMEDGRYVSESPAN